MLRGFWCCVVMCILGEFRTLIAIKNTANLLIADCSRFYATLHSF